MIAWLLKKLEENPTTLFRKADLLKKSKSQFEKLKKQGFLTFSQPDPHHETYPCNLPCANTCPMEVIEMEGKLFAICPKDTEVDPIPLTKDDISKFRFSLGALIKAIRQANSFTGDTYSITSRLYFIGERVVNELNTAFILALFPNVGSAEPHLLSLLARIPTNYGRMVLVTPSLSLTQDPVYSKLRAASIFPSTIPSSFGQCNCKINYLTALKRRLPAGVSSDTPSLTDGQLADYQKHAYHCQDRLHIPGTFPHKRSNEIFLNGNKLSLGDSLFALLLRFVVELKKGKGGWVNIHTLASERVIADPMKYQIYSNLRSAVEGSLLDKDRQKFIQNDGSKNYRISAHPDFVTYDKERLLNHPDPDIRGLAKRLT